MTEFVEMTGSELREAIDLLWNGNQSQAARDLEVDPRRIRAFLTDPEKTSWRRIPIKTAETVRDLVQMFPNGRNTIDPRTGIQVMHGSLTSGIYSDSMAAGAILGAAMANARKHLSADEIADMIG